MTPPSLLRRGAIGVVFATGLMLLTVAAAEVLAHPEPVELLVYAGGVNRLAATPTILEFEQRENVRVSLVVDGCGVLAQRISRAQAAHGELPDLFLPCDVSYATAFGDLFAKPRLLGETELAIAVAPGNPRGIASLADLARPGLRLGVAGAELSAMGAITRRAADALGCTAGIDANTRRTTALADPLLAGVAAGDLDAAPVFVANAATWRHRVDLVPLVLPGITASAAAAPIASGPHAELSRRLADALTTPVSASRYRAIGFHRHAE
jgi:molybdate transport system substrate-binding protein